MIFGKDGNLYLSPNDNKNILRHKGVDYFIKPLSKHKRSKGGNSNVFILFDPQEKIDFVVKFSKYNLRNRSDVLQNSVRIERFEREISALQIAIESKFDFVVKYYFDGTEEIGKGEFRYFVMEKAEYDLTEYLKQKELTVQQRFLMCTQILNGIKELHNKDIYHRDIKPDNVIMVNGTWKICDLGLMRHRNDDFDKKEVGEKIGPANWMSPEAMNKMYNEGRANPHNFDCGLDSFSDIFQLGKLFWFILQGNVPDGQLLSSDFKIDDAEIYDIIFKMLSHSKTRPNVQEIESEFQKKYSYYGI